MEPLRITATLDGPVILPGGTVAIDALLAAAVALRDQIPPARTPDEIVPIEIPVKREPGGRFHLASFGSYTVEQHEVRYTRKRPVVPEAQALGDPGRKRMNISAGPDKGYQIPREAMHLVDDQIVWWCIGGKLEIEDLLTIVHHLGKKRSVGLGRVREWSVESCDRWGDGFPVVSPDGKPMRNLPLGYPGLGDGAPIEITRLTYPYWVADDRQECVVPC